jgi:hypothetical protein
MRKFDMGAAWDDSMVLLKSHNALTATIAAVFLFLPTLALGWFGPVPIEPATDATFDQMMMAMRESALQAAPYQVLVSVIAAVGGVGILRLWLSRTSTSVGDALVFALKMIPTMIAIQLILGFAIGLAAVLLIMPGIAAGGGAIGALLLFIGVIGAIALCLYLWGRLAVVSPVLVDRTLFNPLTAIQESWRLTKDNGWRICLFLFLVTLVVVIIALLLGGVVAATVGTGDGVGRMLTGVVEGGVAAISGLVSAAIVAATYRQLALGGAGEIFS